jgi:hypothetical protein
MGMLLGFAISGSVLLVFLSAYPGLLSDLRLYVLISAPFWLPALGIGGLVCLDLRSNIVDLQGTRRLRRKWLLVATAVLALNGFLISDRTARRFAFWISRPAFQALVASAPRSGSGDGVLDRRLGVYQVLRCVADLRGGVYFQTHVGYGGLLTHRTTHGFAHNPNSSGTPFGDEQYHCVRLFGDWYCFQATEP